MSGGRQRQARREPKPRPGDGIHDGRHQGCAGGFPSVPSSLRVVPVPQGRSFLASLRDGLRRPLTARPAPEIRGQPGSPQRNGPGQKERDGTSERAGQSPVRLRSLRGPVRRRLRASVAGVGRL
ncbi:hypothetical protein E6U81_35135 [Streptomyces sp. A0592]|nr:hypothetical protein E6U81_35135 [Streptomyces sp. A0592]